MAVRGIPSRAQATERRREEILDAALACFTEKGVAATSIAEIRARSGASIGSIYHHFASKEDLAAALYVEGLGDYQEGLVALLERGPGAEEGIRAIVGHHLGWVRAKRDLAAYLLASREPEVAESSREVLRTMNRRLFAALEDWLAPHIAAGRIRRLPIDLYHAVVLGPAQEHARLWLAGRTRVPMDEASRELGRAAWQAVKTEGGR